VSVGGVDDFDDDHVVDDDVVVFDFVERFEPFYDHWFYVYFGFVG
jgi:hypothetical protein